MKRSTVLIQHSFSCVVVSLLALLVLLVSDENFKIWAILAFCLLNIWTESPSTPLYTMFSASNMQIITLLSCSLNSLHHCVCHYCDQSLTHISYLCENETQCSASDKRPGYKLCNLVVKLRSSEGQVQICFRSNSGQFQGVQTKDL